MNVGELVDLTREKLNEAATLYPSALVVRFLQFAQNLLALHPTGVLSQRVAVTLQANEMLIDLLTHLPRVLVLRRVVLGNVVTQAATLQDANLPTLRRISLEALTARRTWLTTAAGTPRLYYPHGATLIGVWPTPSASMTVTLIGRVLPTPFTVEPVTQAPDLTQVPDALLHQHPLLADLAAGLLLVREGTTEAEKGLQMLAPVLTPTQLQGVRRQLQRSRGTPREQPASEAVA